MKYVKPEMELVELKDIEVMSIGCGAETCETKGITCECEGTEFVG